MEMIKQTRRLLSLDVLRGITVAGMILVNDPGSWGGGLCSFVSCLLEWLDTDGFGFSLFHVYYGSLHVFFIEKIRFYIFLAGGGENTEAVRLDFFNRAGYHLVCPMVRSFM